jgi:hypothetical protein
MGQYRPGGCATPHVDHANISPSRKSVCSWRPRARADDRLAEVDRVEGEVKARLKREINYWDGRAEELRPLDARGSREEDR